MELRQIRITEDVKAELDSLKIDNDSYSTIIRRLISENAELKSERNSFLKSVLIYLKKFNPTIFFLQEVLLPESITIFF